MCNENKKARSFRLSDQTIHQLKTIGGYMKGAYEDLDLPSELKASNATQCLESLVSLMYTALNEADLDTYRSAKHIFKTAIQHKAGDK